MTSTVVKPRRGTFINLLLGWGPTILLNVIMPVLTYNYLHNHHHSQVTSLLAASAWTVFELVLFFVLHRRLDEFGVAVLAFFVLSMIAALGFNSARLLLVKDSVLTGAWGIMLLGSLALPKPLMFYFGRKFATDGTAAGVARWNGLWQYEGFRKGQRFLTVVWGVVLLRRGGSARRPLCGSWGSGPRPARGLRSRCQPRTRLGGGRDVTRPLGFDIAGPQTKR